MLDLLSTFSVTELLIFIVMLAIAFKEVTSFILWIKGLIAKRDENKTSLNDKEKSDTKRLNNVESNVQKIINSVNELSEKVDLLISSDKDDIKSDITRDHHFFCYNQGWIDDYSLDCLEKRYEHYVDEHGNSFIEQLMEEVRKLPKTPPEA